MHETARLCKSLQYTAIQLPHGTPIRVTRAPKRLHPTAIHCNTLQHNATHLLRVTPIHTARVNETATVCNTLRHAASRYNRLQHAASCCNTLQHTCRAARQSMPRAPKSSWHKLCREVRCIEGISQVSSMIHLLCKITLELTFQSTHTYAPHAHTHAHTHTCTHAHMHTRTHAHMHTRTPIKRGEVHRALRVIYHHTFALHQFPPLLQFHKHHIL